MEKISFIINEINEKKGKEWLSLHPKTEQQLMSLAWYLDNPKLQEDLEKIEELVGLYYNAKATSFLRMERIARKLDELSVKIGKVGSIEKEILPSQSEIKPKEKPKQPTIVNYGKAIEELRNRIKRLLNSPSGSNLHENTKNTIITFLNYLNHPNLQYNTELFDEMLEKYEEAEAVDFFAMQEFNNLLNKMEIKLGKVFREMKTSKGFDEREKDLKREIQKIEEEKENLKAGGEKLEAERRKMKLEWEKLEVERGMLKEEQEKLKEGGEKLEVERKKMKLELEKLKVERGKLKEEQENFNKARQNFATERASLTLEQSNLESEKEKLEIVKKKLEEMQKKIENEISKIP